MIVLSSAQGWPVRDIADLAQVSQRYVRRVIHDCNESGFAALDPQWSGSAPKTIDDTTRTRICAIAGCASAGPQFLDFLKVLRARWPGERLYLVMDNYGPLKRPEVRAWCAAHDIELVFLPTNASWLNWIGCEFTALRYFALNGTDHRSHAEQNAAIGGSVSWRNARTRPKTHFAINSPIREPDYVINVA